MYREDPLSKTNQGGLAARTKKPKIVYVYPTSDMNRDPVSYYEKYIGLLAPDGKSKKLYSRCKKFVTPNQWFCNQPLGINQIKTAVKSMCKEAGIQGKFTNHSLRATCASRMFDNEIPEQIIKETTGHKSDCVRVYKRTSDKLHEQACSTIGKDPECADCEKGVVRVENLKSDVKVEENYLKDSVGYLSYDQMRANVLKTKMELRKKLFPKSRLSLKKARQVVKSCKRQLVTIDVNVNVKSNKKSKKALVYVIHSKNYPK